MPPAKKVIKKSVPKKKELEPADVVEASVEEVDVVEASVEEVSGETHSHDLDGEYDEFLGSIDEEISGLEEMRKELTNRIQSLRKIRKSAHAMAKKLSKKKHAKKNPNKKPSGINAPYPIGDIGKTLADFMQTNSDKELTQFSRIDALKAINAYVKEKNLKNSTQGHKTEIKMDATLKKLFPQLVAQKKPLKYTGIMGSLGQHFPKKSE